MEIIAILVLLAVAAFFVGIIVGASSRNVSDWLDPPTVGSVRVWPAERAPWYTDPDAVEKVADAYGALAREPRTPKPPDVAEPNPTREPRIGTKPRR